MKFGETNLPSSAQVRKPQNFAPDKQPPGSRQHTNLNNARAALAMLQHRARSRKQIKQKKGQTNG